MKKKLLLQLLLILLTVFAIAQTPQTIPYQAVARNSSGNLIQNQNVGLRFTVHDLTSTGTSLYQETQSATTNKLGLFSVNLGSGIVTSGSFGGVSWSNGHAKFLQVEIDPAGGTSYTDMGATQMMSVPFALYAGSAGSVPSGNLTEATSNVLSISGGTSSVVSASGTTIQVKKSSSSQDGYLSSSDWTLFNNKQGAISFSTTGNSGVATFSSNALNIPNYTLAGLGGIGLTSLSASSPLSYNNGTGVFSISQANGSTNGYLSTTDWNTFNNKVSGTSTQYYVPHWTSTNGSSGNLSSTSLIYDNGSYVGIGTPGPSALLHLVSSNTTGTAVQLRLAPTGSGGSSTSVPSLIDFYSTFDGYTPDQAPRRTASIKGAFSGGTWGNEALLFEVGTGGANDAGAEPTERMRISGSGIVKVAGLAGTGYRPVYADASGNLSTISGSSSNRSAFTSPGTSNFTVPAGVNLLFVKLWGGGGGSGYSTGDSPGGGGGFVSGFLSVTPGSTLTVLVGSGGAAGTNSSATSGTPSTGSATMYGGGGLAGQAYSGAGGGRSAIQSGGVDLVCAGGGGGGSKNKPYWSGGGGGGLVGAAGSMGEIYNGGSGGTQTGGGVEIGNGTPNTCGSNSVAGGPYQGGRGCQNNGGSPGGGGGYYGGAGGGGGGDGPAGGGSSYISGLVQYMPIRNEQGATADNFINGFTVTQNFLLLPGGTDGSDYAAGVGVGGATVLSGTTGNNGGAGRVVIYW